MKRVHSFIQKYIPMSVLLALSLTMAAQDRTLFTARAQENQNRQLRYTFMTSDTIPLEGFGTIYSLSIDATIHQPREASFTRVVLEDKDGHDYLVAESDWFRNDTTTVTLDHYCEETALLDGITPIRLKCYMAGNAVLSLNGIHFSDQPATRKDGKPIETVRNMKEAQVKNIVERINIYNKKHRKLWSAGVTNKALLRDNMTISNNEELDSYIANTVYYVKGLYEFGEPPHTRNNDISLYVDSFDWRNRHGKNWITIPKDQMGSSWCSIFSVVGMIEAYTRIHFNQLLDLDLSEKDLALSCGLTYHQSTLQQIALQEFCQVGIIDEETEPFDSLPGRLHPRDCCEELIRVPNFKDHRFNSNIDTIEVVKNIIINNGPVASGYNSPYNNWHHAMLLVGYGKITTDVLYSYVDSHGVDIDTINDGRLGQTYLIFKDSYYQDTTYCSLDHGHDGYMYAVFYHTKNYLYHPISIYGNLVSKKPYVIQCVDEDGDGYFTWGHGNKPSNCPPWAYSQQDGDDSDWTLGHMNEYGFCDTLSYTQPVYEYIYNDSTFTSSTSVAKNLGVMRGATLTLNAHLTLSNGSKLLLDNGATLVINGTYISGSKIQAYAGSKIILNNNARIQKPFEVPDGVELIINYGRID